MLHVSTGKIIKTAEPFEVRITDIYNYLMSYGGQSPFYKELNENKRFVGAKCSKCGMVWCPPRNLCSTCLYPTELVPLSDEGEVITALVLSQHPHGMGSYKYPIAAALIRLDGADTCLKAAVVTNAHIKYIEKGMRVKVQLRKKRIEILTDFYFKPI